MITHEKWTNAAVLTLVCALAWTGAAQENTNAPPKSALERFATQDYMLGDWGGVRPELSKHGVDFEFLYVASNPHNIHGGIETGAAYEGALLMMVDLDSQKLVGYEGGHLEAGGLWLTGQGHFSDTYIGDFNKVNLVDFPNTARLWQLWYEQKFWHDRISVKAGEMAVDQDFIKPEFYGGLGNITLWNQTFFYPTLAFNVWNVPPTPGPLHALASTPYGAPGVLLKVDATEQIYVQAAAYDGYPNINGNGLNWTWNSSEGTLFYFETGYRLNQGKEDTGLPGNFKLGAFLHSGDYPDNVSLFQNPAVFVNPAAGTVSFHPNTYGAYFLADQMLFFEKGKDDPAKQGLAGFFRMEGAPADRSLTTFGVDAGLVYKGLIPTRDWDTLALAASYLKMSSDIRQGQENANAVAPGTYPKLADYEAVVELTYKAQLTAWWSALASLQTPIHPGGRVYSFAGVPQNAWAFILATELRL